VSAADSPRRAVLPEAVARRLKAAGLSEREARPLARSFYARDPVTVASELLGRLMVSRIGDEVTAVRLVEVEAYWGEHDPGSHAHRGRTPRNAVMFGPPGHLYVYFTYGMHWCVNVVTGTDGEASAVLVRAGEPLVGQEAMAQRRAGVVRRDWCRGPARLAQALGLDGTINGTSLLDGPASLLHGRPVSPKDVVRTPRVGLSAGIETPWRFAVRDCPYVSGPRCR